MGQRQSLNNIHRNEIGYSWQNSNFLRVPSPPDPLSTSFLLFKTKQSWQKYILCLHVQLEKFVSAKIAINSNETQKTPIEIFW